MGTPSFTVISFAYPRISLSEREELGRALARLVDQKTIVFVTCLRVLVASTGDEAAVRRGVEQRIGRTIDESTVKSGTAAVAHLVSVVSGLQSPVRGEGEVLTQFRRQILARDLAPDLRHLVERTVGVAREIQRTVAAPRGSLARVAVDLIPDDAHLTVVGAGEMARTVIDLAIERVPSVKVTHVVRRPDEAADRSGVDVFGMDRLPDLLATASVVVSATSAGGRLIEPDALRRVLERRSRPLLLVDLAMPPDFGPPADPNLRYLSIDDLADQVADLAGDDGLDVLVDDIAEDTWRVYSHSGEVGPVITRLFTEVDELVDETVSRFQGRLRDHHDSAVLREAVRSAVRKVMASPVERIHRSQSPSHTAAEVAELFGFATTNPTEDEESR